MFTVRSLFDRFSKDSKHPAADWGRLFCLNSIPATNVTFFGLNNRVARVGAGLHRRAVARHSHPHVARVSVPLLAVLALFALNLAESTQSDATELKLEIWNALWNLFWSLGECLVSAFVFCYDKKSLFGFQKPHFKEKKFLIFFFFLEKKVLNTFLLFNIFNESLTRKLKKKTE